MAERARVVVIPIEVEAPPFAPRREDLPPEVLATMLPHAELDDDLSDSEILEVADPIALGAPVGDRGPTDPVLSDEAHPVMDAVTAAPEPLPTKVGASEPMAMEVLAEDLPETEEPRILPVVPLVAPPDLPGQPPVDRLPFGPEPTEAHEEPDHGPMLATPTAAPTPTAEPEFAIDLDITGSEKPALFAVACGCVGHRRVAGGDRRRRSCGDTPYAQYGQPDDLGPYPHRLRGRRGRRDPTADRTEPDARPRGDAGSVWRPRPSSRLEALRGDTVDVPVSARAAIAESPAASADPVAEPDAALP